MKKKFFVFFTAIIVVLSCMFAAACSSDNYGTLTVDNVSVIMGEDSVISYRFSIPERAEKITYLFDGNDIEIKDGKVKALVGDKTITVTAKTTHHETTFTVTTYSVDLGTISIADLYAWVDYPASELVGYPASEIDISFEYSEYEEELVYSYDETKLQIDAAKKTVKALSAGDFEVTATRISDGFSTTFTVHAETVDRNSSYFNVSSHETNAAYWKTYWDKHGKDGSTTLFIGDSYFGGSFWSDDDFYTTYKGKDVIRSGIGGTTSCEWEVFTDTYLKYTNPKNIVMHVGTNNVYTDGMNAEELFKALQRMFYLIHDRVPSAKIYYFNISQRKNDDAKKAIVSQVNADMKDWCEKRDWITLIDTCSLLTPDMLLDNTHYKPEYYYIFVDELNKTDIVINDLTTDN